jgi:hypothetical protein
LDALHDLARMAISDDNSMLNHIKYLACCKLIDPVLRPGDTSPKSDLDKTLRDLNAAYQASAPRIKAIRERIISLDEGIPRPTESD